MLAKNGLEVSRTHSSLDDLINKYDETVAFHKAIGNKYYILPSYRLSNQQEIDYFVEKVNEIMPKLEKDGITLAFHNHARECVPNADGSVALEQMIYRTNIKLEIDTYWAYVGMKNPVELITRLKDRIVRIHVKDGFIDGKGMPLGMGTAPVKEVYEKAKELGFLMVVESETCTPSGMAEAEICINYLKSLE
jgi:sugar phosphate isomerase/epimerase